METELKLHIAPRDGRRLLRHPAVVALKRGRARRQRFVATYFDTPALELSRAGVAFRVRQEGARWVQTVKAGNVGAGGLHRREEFEWPLPADRPDFALVETTPLAKLFAKPGLQARLAPVFVTDFVRTAATLAFADGAVAELAVDAGEIRAGSQREPISEAEIELKSGSAANAFTLALAVCDDLPVRLGLASKAERGYALAAGAAPRPRKAAPVALERELPAGQALARIAWAAIAQMQANEGGTVRGEDPEYLHQLRVGLRRLRSILALARAPLAASIHASLLEDLRALQRALNPARDWDVFATETLPPIVAAFPEVSGLKGIRVRAGQLRRAHDRAAAEVVAAPDFQKLLLRLGLALTDGTLEARDATTAWLGGPARAYAAQILEARYRKVRKRGKRLATATPQERHATRIAAKKLRYAAEFFAPLFAEKRARRFAGALAELQDVLGALNDAAVTARLLDELATAGRTPPDTAAAGIVRGWVGGAAHHGAGELEARWRGFRKQAPFWR
ncbi:MAG: CHAD domain-containing protein [Burkholderiales bacterium]|nr:CHAD domain-containing protein [Burkholderiales bacterium]